MWIYQANIDDILEGEQKQHKAKVRKRFYIHVYIYIYNRVYSSSIENIFQCNSKNIKHIFWLYYIYSKFSHAYLQIKNLAIENEWSNWLM